MDIDLAAVVMITTPFLGVLPRLRSAPLGRRLAGWLRLDDRAVVLEVGIRRDGAVALDADRLEGWLWNRWDGLRWLVSVTEEGVERTADGSNVGRCNAKRRSGQSDVLHEPAELCSIESHEFVHFVHAGVPGVRGHRLAIQAAAEQAGEEFV